ncbi:hypothetical protein ACROYT_G003797 [Oculina patagonica]
MELWWIILAGCGGGLLLLAYVAVVAYKIFRRKKRVQMNQYPDPERLTDDKDWAVHVKASEVSERKVDGLCMDTISGSTKLRRKLSTSTPSVSQIPGDPEEVPVVSPQINPTEKQNGRIPSPGPQALASTSRLDGAALPDVVTAAPRKSPEVVQRSEYTWETLLRQPSDVRKKRSQSFNWDDSAEHRKANGTTRSLKYDKESQEKRFARSKSLRGYTKRELAILAADETVPFDKIVISLKREGEKTKRNKSKKSPKAQRTVTDATNEVKKAKATKQNSKISRSGSAPSLRAKEKRQEKATHKNNVCVVEIHNVPRDRHAEVSTTIGTDTQVVDGFPSTSIQQPSPSHEDQTNFSTIVDVETILPVPGIAKRVPTVLNDQRPDENEETHVSINNTRERKSSVKNRVQNLETQVVNAEPSSRHFQATTLQRNYTVVTAAPSTTDINNNSIALPNWRQNQTMSEVREEPNISNSQTGQPSFQTKPVVRSIGKMTIVKHGETASPRANPEKPPQNPIKGDPPKSFDRAPSTQVRQLTESTLAKNTTVLLRKAEEQRKSETSFVPVGVPPPPPPPPPPISVNPLSSGQAMGNDVKISILSKGNQDANSEKSKETNVPKAREADTNLTLDERKKTWKREQLVDQLHNARARNANQNYIFGTGLAYQSCMPELQNKLKQLALAK